MNSEQIQESLFEWLYERKGYFNAPYGILTGEEPNKHNKGIHRTLTFGCARTLDATISVYNRNFIIYNDSRYGRQTFKSYEDLMEYLKGRFR